MSYFAILQTICTRLKYLDANIERNPHGVKALAWTMEKEKLQKLHTVIEQNGFFEDIAYLMKG